MLICAEVGFYCPFSGILFPFSFFVRWFLWVQQRSVWDTIVCDTLFRFWFRVLLRFSFFIRFIVSCVWRNGVFLCTSVLPFFPLFPPPSFFFITTTTVSSTSTPLIPQSPTLPYTLSSPPLSSSRFYSLGHKWEGPSALRFATDLIDVTGRGNEHFNRAPFN